MGVVLLCLYFECQRNILACTHGYEKETLPGKKSNSAQQS